MSHKSFHILDGKVRMMADQDFNMVEYQDSGIEHRGIPLWVPWNWFWNGLLISLLLLILLSGCGTTTLAHPAPVHSLPTATHTVHRTGSTSSSSNSGSKSLASPARLLIPSIHVDAHVEALGQLANGDLATPVQSPWQDVGWFSSGPTPGAKGSAVIDGHLDRPGGYPAVFWNLRQLHPGDSVQVLDTSGIIHRFRVTLVALYPPQDAPLQGIFGNEQNIYLNLITCAGDWIPSEHQTTLRLVVYTVAVK